MSKVETLPKPVGGPSEEMSVAEVNLGKVLVLIHQTLARLADGCSTADVQAALRKASAFLDMARQAHESGLVVGDTAQTSVEAAINYGIGITNRLGPKPALRRRLMLAESC